MDKVITWPNQLCGRGGVPTILTESIEEMPSNFTNRLTCELRIEMGDTTQHQSDDLGHPCQNGFSPRIEPFNRCLEVRWGPLTQIDRNPRPIREKE